MRGAKGMPHVPKDWSETLRLCPFRSFVGVGSAGDPEDMMGRVSHTFAAIGGEQHPIGGALLDEMATSIRAGGVVLVVADRADLRDHAKRQILAKVHGVAGCA